MYPLFCTFHSFSALFSQDSDMNSSQTSLHTNKLYRLGVAERWFQLNKHSWNNKKVKFSNICKKGVSGIRGIRLWVSMDGGEIPHV